MSYNNATDILVTKDDPMGNFKLGPFEILVLYDEVIWAPWRETGGTIIAFSMPGLPLSTVNIV